MVKIFNFLTVLALILLASCSFNRKFLRPEKVPVGAKKLTIATAKDTTVIYFSQDTHQPTFIKNRRDTLNFDFTIESVVFKSANGNKLNGWFLKSKNNIATVTLLHLHGTDGYLLNQYELMAPLLKNGLQIFLFDYSGYGFSEGNATRKNILTDALSAFDYLIERPEVKNTKLVLYGQSLGGHLAATVGEQRQNSLDGLVIEGGYTSDKDMAATIAGIFGRIFVKEMYSAKKAIKRFHKPLLIIHSTEDKDVPFRLGKKLFDYANLPKEFYEIKHPHINGSIYYSNEISQKIKTMGTKN